MQKNFEKMDLNDKLNNLREFEGLMLERIGEIKKELKE